MPIQKAWYPLMDGHCISQQAVQIGSAIFNAISDFAILILPAGSIWNLHIHRQGKIGLFVIFSFGILWVLTLRFYFFRDRVKGNRLIADGE